MKRAIILVFSCLLMIASYKTINASGIAYTNINDLNSIELNSIMDNYTPYYLDKGDGWSKLVKVVSSNNTIATVEVVNQNDYFYIKGKNPGTCNVTITDEHNEQTVVKVVITKKYYLDLLEDECYCYGHYYGSKKITIVAFPNSSGTIKIRKDVYKYKIGASGKKSIKLKRRYKLNEKITHTLKKDEFTFTHKFKIYSETELRNIDGWAKNKLRLDVFCAHKGDYIKLKHRGKTYTKKINKDYDWKTKTFTFKIKKKVNTGRIGDTVKVTIYNKAKKKLHQFTFNLRYGWASIHGDEKDDD